MSLRNPGVYQKCGPSIPPILSTAASLFHVRDCWVGTSASLEVRLSQLAALAQHELYRPSPHFPTVFNQTWKEETTERHLKPSTSAQISQAPDVTSTLLSATARGQGPTCLPQCKYALTASPNPGSPDKGGSCFSNFNLRPISSVFTSCTGIDLVPGGPRTQASISGETPAS